MSTGLLATLTWLPGGSPAPTWLHQPGSDRRLILARATGGTGRWASGRVQYNATALVAPAAVRRVSGLPAGVHHLHRVMKLAELPTGRGIDIHRQAD